MHVFLCLFSRILGVGSKQDLQSISVAYLHHECMLCKVRYTHVLAVSYGFMCMHVYYLVHNISYMCTCVGLL